MTISIATEARPGKERNEDLAFFVDGLAGVLDGASLPYDPPCGHDSAWYVRVLAKHLLAGRMENPEGTLTGLLRQGIGRSAREHADGCDHQDKPLSGAATVVLVRQRGDWLDYLVLCDSTLLIASADGREGPRVVTDERIAGLPLRSGTRIKELLAEGRGYGAEYWALQRAQARELAGYRNVEGGYWIAADEPAAADQAITGTTPLGVVALATDGVTRAATSLGVYEGWGALLCGLRNAGPAAVVEAVRRAERDDPEGIRCPRGSAHDDATALVWSP